MITLQDAAGILALKVQVNDMHLRHLAIFHVI